MEGRQVDEKVLEKYNQIQEEILQIGWKGILEKYHPDVNCDHPDAQAVFKLYKYIYDDIRKRIIVQ